MSAWKWWWGAVVCAWCSGACGYPPLPRLDDASIGVVPDLPHLVFTWQLATSQPSGAPQPMLSYPPLTAGLSPQIRIATLGGAFEHADYLSSPGTEGWILIPRSYLGTTWRSSTPCRAACPTRSSGRPRTSSAT
jgi:hypothetical protein